MSFFKRSGPKKKDLLLQLERLQQELNAYTDINKQLELGSFEQFDRNQPDISTSSFYDGVIDIPNLRGLREGWKIDVKDHKEYNNLVQKKGIVVSIVGNYGKGKTFLLRLLSDQDTPHGFNVNTQGISIRYLRDKSDNKVRPVIMLDTKGGSLPLDMSQKGEQSRLDQAVSLLEKKREEDDRFKQILRDHDATEDVLQNFIMEEANIILIVVSDLTFPDQRLITKITSKFKENESKSIIVVHNLYHAKSKKDVQNKLDEFILRSFKLKCTEFSEFEPEKNNQYYVEKIPKCNALVHHVILAKQGTEAGNYYNHMTIKHIKSCIDANGHSKSIDVIAAFHSYLQRSLQSYIDAIPKLESNDITLEKNGNDGPVKLIMAPKDKFELKAVMTDELGHLRIFKESNQFQPKYCLYEENKSEIESFLCMKIEFPDGLPELEIKVRHHTDEFSIQISGVKPEGQKTSKQKLVDTRESGDFFVETEMFPKAKYRFDYDAIIEKPTKHYERGTIILKWRLRPVNDGAWQKVDADADTDPNANAEEVEVAPMRVIPAKFKGSIMI